MAKQSNLQLYRGQGVPPANSMLEGEIAMDTDRKVLWINNGQAIKPVGIIEGGTTPPADYAGTLWIDNNASPTGIPADFLVANNLTTQTPGAYVLDAYQGKILKEALDAQQLTISDQGDEISGLSGQIDNLDAQINNIGAILTYNGSFTKSATSVVNFTDLLTVTEGTWILVAHCVLNQSTSNGYVQLHFINSSDDNWGHGGNGGDWTSGECEQISYVVVPQGTTKSIGITCWSTNTGTFVINKLTAIRII